LYAAISLFESIQPVFMFAPFICFLRAPCGFTVVLPLHSAFRLPVKADAAGLFLVAVVAAWVQLNP
jgi:hypothetical protein